MAHLSTKGQLTIPQAIRDEFGLSPGSAVTIEVRDGEIVIRPAVDAGPSPAAQTFVERLRGSATIGMTTDEIMALTRGED